MGVAVLILLSMILPSLGLASGLYPQTVEVIQRITTEQIGSEAASAWSVAIAEGDSIIYAKAFGIRDWPLQLPADVHTQFNFGSVTKVLTAASILLLCDEGKLDLDQPVVRYLPEFTLRDERYRQITVRMLLNHSSGLPGTNYRDGFAVTPNLDYVAQTLDVLRDHTLKHDPGTISVYCNDGFTLAEGLIEKVSGLRFADFLRKNFFEPLGMNDSGFYLSGSNAAHIFAPDGSVLYPLERVSILGSGGLSSTPSDLVRLGQAIYEGTLLSPESMQEFEMSQLGPDTVPEGRSIVEFGLGWDDVEVEIFAEQGVWVLSKTGGTLMYTSQLHVVPDYDIAIAVTFAGMVDTDAVLTQITQSLLEEKHVLTPQTKSHNSPQHAAIPKALESFEGYYGTTDSITRVEFDWELGALNYWVFDGSEFVLSEVMPYQDDGAFHSAAGTRMHFTTHNGDQVIVGQLALEGSIIIGQKIRPLRDPLDGSAFAHRVWIPRNYSAIDLAPAQFILPETGIIRELPGYVYAMYGLPGDYTPYELIDPLRGGLCIKYKRDQTEPILQDYQGEMLLYLGGYIYSDGANALNLVAGEMVIIPELGLNECRQIAEDCQFRCTVPDGGRAMVFSPTQEVMYDSLLTEVDSLTLEKGSYVLFIGDSGAVFEPHVF